MPVAFGGQFRSAGEERLKEQEKRSPSTVLREEHEKLKSRPWRAGEEHQKHEMRTEVETKSPVWGLGSGNPPRRRERSELLDLSHNSPCSTLNGSQENSRMCSFQDLISNPFFSVSQITCS